VRDDVRDVLDPRPSHQGNLPPDTFAHFQTKCWKIFRVPREANICAVAIADIQMKDPEETSAQNRQTKRQVLTDKTCFVYQLDKGAIHTALHGTNEERRSEGGS
jgi:hypothetical protein